MLVTFKRPIVPQRALSAARGHKAPPQGQQFNFTAHFLLFTALFNLFLIPCRQIKNTHARASGTKKGTATENLNWRDNFQIHTTPRCR
jgi:hypothetical protein